MTSHKLTLCALIKKTGKDKERNECDGKQGNNARNNEGELKCVETRRAAFGRDGHNEGDEISRRKGEGEIGVKRRERLRVSAGERVGSTAVCF